MGEFIEREAALREFDTNGSRFVYGLRTCRAVQSRINLIPAADVRPVVRGEWVKNGWSIRCSICRYDMPFSTRNFCPNCGADMREADHD